MQLLSWRVFLGTMGLLAAVVGTGGLRAGGTSGPSTGPVSAEELDRLIGELGNPSYDRRTEATRRLCAVGMQAYEPLQRVTQGRDAEAAIRASALLRTLDRLLFSGVEVELSFDPPAVAWNQPTTLRFKMRNTSSWPARVPFDSSGESSDAGTRQLGLMLDVADWLRVESADGNRVELHTDDVAANSKFAREVERRLENAPVSTLGPGEERTVNLVEFNRGWGRYRLLDAGVYAVQLDYDPPWSDAVLLEQHVGRVVSNRVSLTISDSAPEVVSRAGGVATLTMEQVADELVVTLRNRTDVPFTVDIGFGRDEGAAKGTWVHERGEVVHSVPHLPTAGVGRPADKSELLREVGPGEALEIVRTPRAEVMNALHKAGISVEGGEWTLAFRYWNPAATGRTNLASRNPAGQAIVEAPQPSASDRRMLTTHHVSNQLVAPLGD